jgi:hypothetical protein
MHATTGSREGVRFVLNAHGPTFQKYSMLCIKSIRRVCGPEAPIRVYQPDNLPPVPDRTMQFYATHGVELVNFHNEFLPDRLEDLSRVPARHLTLNKVYCLQGMEPGERRLFVDADILFLRDPRPLLDAVTDAAACVQVDTPGAFGGDWAALYKHMEVPYPVRRVQVWERYAYGSAAEPPKVDMIPYFNSGVVYVDSRSKLPDAWLAMCRRLEERIELIPRSYFLDQIALSLAIHDIKAEWTLLPKGMNCTYEVWQYTPDVHLLHYIGFDTLAAAAARFPEVSQALRDVVPKLAREDDLDLRFQLLTQWPRWFRRALWILSSYSERFLGRPLLTRSERT